MNSYERVKMLAQQKGVSWYKLSKETGISESSFSHWKKGDSEPKFSIISRIADYFDVSVDYLINGNEAEEIKFKIPVLGVVPCGTPIEAIEEIIEYIDVVPPKSQMIKKNKRKFVTDRNTLNAVKEAIMHTFCEQEAKSVCMGLEIMWYLGLRPAECFALTKDDIKDGRVSINKELGSPIASRNGLGKRNNSIVRKCKTEASIRDIPIPEKLQKLLDSYHVKGKILLPNKSNEHFNVCLLGQRIRKLGIPFNMYQLRHTLATRLIVANVDERTIIEILGHEHINMSIYYARSNDDLKANALNNIND